MNRLLFYSKNESTDGVFRYISAFPALPDRLFPIKYIGNPATMRSHLRKVLVLNLQYISIQIVCTPYDYTKPFNFCVAIYPHLYINMFRYSET